MNTDELREQEIRNELSATLYGQYYYELPDGWTEAKSVVERCAKVAFTNEKRIALEARIDTANHIQSTMVSDGSGYCDEIRSNAIPDYVVELKSQLQELEK